MRRVAITGVGTCASLGIGSEMFWKNILSGKKGITRLQDDYKFITSRVAGLVNDDEFESALSQFKERQSSANDGISPLRWNSISRSNLMGIIAASEALQQAGWEPLSRDVINNDCDVRLASNRAGVCFGSGMDPVQEVFDTYQLVNGEKLSRFGPYHLTRTMPNMHPSVISMLWGLRGPCSSINTACATGLHSIGDAYRMREADLVVAGGTDSTITPWYVASFARINALSTKYNESPLEASRPFDVGRDGFVIAEGAGAVVLQAWPPTRGLEARCPTKINPIAEVIGYGRTADANSLVAPDGLGDGAYRSMKAAFHDAKNLSISEIGHINCHATSTPRGDATELVATLRFLNDEGFSVKKNKKIIMNSLKGHTGHSLCASGAIETVATAMTLRDGLIPRTCNLNRPVASEQIAKIIYGNAKSDRDRITRECIHIYESGTDFLLNSPSHVEWPVEALDKAGRRVALTNSNGFGGANGSLLMAEWRD